MKCSFSTLNKMRKNRKYQLELIEEGNNYKIYKKETDKVTIWTVVDANLFGKDFRSEKKMKEYVKSIKG